MSDDGVGQRSLTADLGRRLLIAAEKGDTRTVKSLLDRHHAPIDHISPAGLTPLMVTCSHGRARTALELISRSANVYIKDMNGSTALEYAAHNGLSSVLAELVRRGAPLNSRNKKGETALLVAVRSDRTGAVRVLTEAGSEVEIQSEDGTSPLFATVSLGSEKAVKLLLKVGADPNTRNTASQQSPLMTATVNRHLEICQHLLAYGADTTVTFDKGRTCLHMACHKGYANICSALLGAGAYVNRRDDAGATPLCLTTKNNHKDIGGQLIRYGADTSPVAFFDGVIKGLVAPFKPQLSAALVKAVREGQADVVNKHKREGERWRFPAVRGVDTSLACDCFGHTLMHLAAIEGHHHIIDILVDMGAQVDCRTVAGLTPLHLSVDGGHLEATKRLIARGANVSSADNDGRTCLMHAKDLHVAKELLAAGAVASAVDTSGANALHHLAAVGDDVGPVICALVHAGADPSQRDKKGRTAAVVARLANCLDTEALLLVITKQTSHKAVRSEVVVKTGAEAGEEKTTSGGDGTFPCIDIAAQPVESKMLSVEIIESEGGRKDSSRSSVSTECVTPKPVLVDEVKSPEVWSPPPPAGSSSARSYRIVDAGPRIGEEGFSFAGLDSSGTGADVFAFGADNGDAGVLTSTVGKRADSSGTLSMQAHEPEINLPTEACEEEAKKERKTKRKVRPCARCGTVTHRRCSKCRVTFFCGRECFKAAWKGHMAMCLAIRDLTTVDSSD